MSEERAKRIHKIYGIALSLVLLAAGICLIAACVGIYRSGDKPFSRAAVAAAFAPIRFPVYLCLAMVIGSFVLRLILPVTKEKLRPQRQTPVIWQRLCERADLDSCESDLKTDILSQRKKRQRFRLVALLSAAICAAIFLYYCLNSGNFHTSEINTSMVNAMYVLLPCSAIPFVLAVFCGYFCRASMEKEIALLKQAPKTKAEDKCVPVKKDWIGVFRTAVLVIAVASLTFGLLNDGAMDVLTKAVNICTECVGLG